MNVLVLEHSKTVRLMLSELLNRGGHTATPVSTGHEAIDALDEAHYDICLINPHIPGNNGIELIYEIASHDDLHGLAIILITDDPGVYYKFETSLKNLGVRAIAKRADLTEQSIENLLLGVAK